MDMSDLPSGWAAVDAYFSGALLPQDEALMAALRTSEEADLPAINVAANQGKLLQLLAMSVGAWRILEVGTLGGYSTIWLARALPEDGRLITLELDSGYAEIARKNISNAGLSDRVDVRVGVALDTLAALAAEDPDPFDFFFIDADKQNNVGYFEWALKLSRPGSMIIVDNVVRRGAVIDPDNDDPRVQGVRRFVERIANEPRVTATALQTVGEKGYDGFAMMLVTG